MIKNDPTESCRKFTSLQDKCGFIFYFCVDSESWHSICEPQLDGILLISVGFLHTNKVSKIKDKLKNSALLVYPYMFKEQPPAVCFAIICLATYFYSFL